MKMRSLIVPSSRLWIAVATCLILGATAVYFGSAWSTFESAPVRLLMGEYLFGDEESMLGGPVGDGFRRLHFKSKGRQRIMAEVSNSIEASATLLIGYDELINKFPSRREIAQEYMLATFCELDENTRARSISRFAQNAATLYPGRPTIDANLLCIRRE